MVNYVYDAWGNHVVLDADGNDIDDATHIGNRNPFRYRGYFYDTETGLYFLKTRYYDPEIGRFITIDGISYLDPETINGLNLYAYCGNNPVMRIDENGNAWWDWLLGALACVVLVAGAIALTVFSGGTAVAALAPMVGLAINCAASVVTGAAIASVFSYVTQIRQGSIDWISFWLDIGIGALSGLVSFGMGQILNGVGQFAGAYLSQLKIGNQVLTKFVSLNTFMQIGGKVVEIGGGFISGLLFDDQLNKLFNRPLNGSLNNRIEDSLQSEFLSKLFKFISYIWR